MPAVSPVGVALGSGVGDPVPPGVAVVVGVGASVGEGEVEGAAPPQAASTSRKAASTVARRFMAGILAWHARMAVS
jgi:hypothetical protein